MKHFIEAVGYLIFIVTWVSGMVIASGFWSTLVSIFLPPWGWYLLMERALIAAGLI